MCDLRQLPKMPDTNTPLGSQGISPHDHTSLFMKHDDILSELPPRRNDFSSMNISRIAMHELPTCISTISVIVTGPVATTVLLAS
jgi:hypothetical protein